MPKTMTGSTVTQQAAECVFPRPNLAKVTDVRPTTTGLDDVGDPTLRDTPVSDLWFSAGKDTLGKQTNQADEVGKERSNYIRDAKKAAELLESLGPAFCAVFGLRMWMRFGASLETPQQRAHRLIDGMQADLNELRAIVNVTKEA